MEKTSCWQRCLNEDVHLNLRQKENMLPRFHAQSPQLGQRRYLVDWLSVIWDKHSICPTARQLSITLLDFFMDMFDIESRQLQLVALGSFSVATKFEEQDVLIPRISDLRHDLPDLHYTGREFLHMELLLLDFYDWKVSFPTPAHFTEYYLEFALDSTDSLHGKTLPPMSHTQEHMNKYTTYFLEITMQDHYYREFQPSKVAASCIACSRVCLRIEPSWNKKLAMVADYTLEELKPLMEPMLRTHSEDELLQAVPPTPPATPEQMMGSVTKSLGPGTPQMNAIHPHSFLMDTPSTPSCITVWLGVEPLGGFPATSEWRPT